MAARLGCGLHDTMMNLISMTTFFDHSHHCNLFTALLYIPRTMRGSSASSSIAWSVLGGLAGGGSHLSLFAS